VRNARGNDDNVRESDGSARGSAGSERERNGMEEKGGDSYKNVKGETDHPDDDDGIGSGDWSQCGRGENAKSVRSGGVGRDGRRGSIESAMKSGRNGRGGGGSRGGRCDVGGRCGGPRCVGGGSRA
jgi:hypothetical protein